MNKKMYHEKVIDEILQLIKDNLVLLYNFNDDALLNIRKYCNKHLNTRYKSLSYQELIYFADEALAELINCPEWYDFRALD